MYTKNDDSLSFGNQYQIVPSTSNFVFDDTYCSLKQQDEMFPSLQDTFYPSQFIQK
jgi:hypothetical protein